MSRISPKPSTGCEFPVPSLTTPMAVLRMAPTLCPLRKTTSVCGLSSWRRRCRPSPRSRTRSTVEPTTHTASPPPAAGPGYLPLAPRILLSINVNNIGQQITDYLATHPKINDKTLFVVWGGAIDVLYATSSNDVINPAINQANNIQRLIEAGATHFIVPNLPPLGLVPRLNGSPTTSIPATQASVLYNDVLAAGLDILRDFNLHRRLELVQLDVFALFNHIVASPARYSLVDISTSSQGIPTIDPDTYLFWDDLHPTTRGHNILALTAARVIARRECWARLEVNCESVSAGGGGGHQ